MTAVLERPLRQGVLTGRGLFAVERGRGAARALACLLRMPRAGAGVPVLLTVTRHPWGETWERDFAGRRLVTTRHLAGGRLVERAGPLRLEFRCRAAADGSLTLATARVRLRGLPLPARVVATVSGDAAWLAVDVAISAPVVGLVLRYGGPLAIEER